jgi:antitoxin Phd
MQVYTYSEARQKLASVLEEAENTGKVLIRRKDGRTFSLVPEKNISSPLDVPSIEVKEDRAAHTRRYRVPTKPHFFEHRYR